jgi:hypothetical protein
MTCSMKALAGPHTPARRKRSRAKADQVLSLVAAPIFAVMALITATANAGEPGVICGMVHGGSLLTGMMPMYLLMSAVHSAPWARLIGDWLSGKAMRSP